MTDISKEAVDRLLDGVTPGPWPNPNCNEPGCMSLAQAAIAALPAVPVTPEFPEAHEEQLGVWADELMADLVLGGTMELANYEYDTKISARKTIIDALKTANQAKVPPAPVTLAQALEVPEVKLLVEAARGLRGKYDQAMSGRTWSMTHMQAAAAFDAALAALDAGADRDGGA